MVAEPAAADRWSGQRNTGSAPGPCRERPLTSDERTACPPDPIPRKRAKRDALRASGPRRAQRLPRRHQARWTIRLLFLPPLGTMSASARRRLRTYEFLLA